MTDTFRSIVPNRLLPGVAAEGREAFCTSGTSPTTIHLVGPGQVGQAFLRLLSDTPFQLVGVTDSSATVHARGGLDPEFLAEWKGGGSVLCDVPGSESLPVDLALDLVNADVVVDATPTGKDAASSVRRNLRVLRRGKRLALASKDVLCCAGQEVLRAQFRDHVGIHAVLGGTGDALRRELLELRRDCRGVALVGNASTTAVIESVERGGSIEDGIRDAQQRGVLEPDPELDLSGADAATKLLAVIGALWGTGGSVPRQHLRSLDVEMIRSRFSRGNTTRLVARGRREGGLRVAFEEVPRTSVLAVPATHVVYTYELQKGGSRVHTGHGIGPKNTAEALLHDVRALAGRRAS